MTNDFSNHNYINHNHNYNHHNYIHHDQNYNHHNYTHHDQNYNYYNYTHHDHNNHNYKLHNFTHHNENCNLHILYSHTKPGSVIVDYSITVTSANPDLAPANNQLVTSLINQGLPIIQNPLTHIVPDGIYGSSSTVYPGTNVSLICSIQPSNVGKIDWAMNGNILQNTSKHIISASRRTLTVTNVNSTNSGLGCNTCNYKILAQDCLDNGTVINARCQATGSDATVYEVKTFWINAINKVFKCFDQYFGGGNVYETKVGDCTEDMVGNRTAQCNSSGLWDPRNQPDNCVLRVIQNLIYKAQILVVAGIPQFTAELSNATVANAPTITQSPANVLGIVGILQQIASVSQTTVISQPVMTSFLQTLDVITSKNASTTWTTLNRGNTTQNTSSVLLMSIEDIGQKLTNQTFGIVTNTIQLNRTNISAPYFEPFGINSTMLIDIPQIPVPVFFTFIVFSTLNTVLPVRNATNNDSSKTGTSINGDVVVVKAETRINNISFSFSLINNSLKTPQCVFWNFSLLDGIGGWDSTGCQLKSLANHTDLVTCECNHTTSFSILMSPYSLDNPALAYITYIGVSISMASLVLCLIIETIIWKSMTRNDTSYMRHVSIVNIAVSLLIADICFMIGASIVERGQVTPVGPCSAVTFFIHFFYLVLFFWMFLSALLLLYRTIMVFSGMSRSRMLAIAFSVGYGAPLLIAVITVASTAGNRGYVQESNSCWLNWDQTKALLAFAIPALTIVVINLLVLIMVIYKMLRRGVGASTRPDDKHALAVIARCVGILTPIFGLTWGFGIGTMVTSDLRIHVAFTILNSLQGFFILMFGTLLDNKIREALARRLSLINNSSNRTRSTSAGPSSSSGLPFIRRIQRRNVYNIAEGNGFSAASSSNSDTLINI
ncbi:adhesion G protein-coupled receptor F4-like [Electrophorus electricus]|uniref:adhesion G protein-coupled receptor F4-like n=1 Tax=Electrophorus electricus TaxID=8005 RepID=UPI0015CFFD12|nr:adhesion G protein-coupled receptor F4-like [Electrophorus electricus]